MEDIITLIAPYQAHITTLITLVILDTVTGALSALKTKQFDLRRLADVYQTAVLPQVGGFFALSIAAPYLSTNLLGDAGETIASISVNGLWLTAVASQVASIARNVRTITGNDSK